MRVSGAASWFTRRSSFSPRRNMFIELVMRPRPSTADGSCRLFNGIGPDRAKIHPDTTPNGA